MNTKHFMMTLLAGLALTACSEKENISTESNENWTKDGKGWIAVRINLPTSPSATRAENDKFDDGLADEYKVSNVKLLIFKGNTEAEAKYSETRDLTSYLPEFTGGTSTDNLTSTYLVSTEVNATSTDHLWALALINSDEVFNSGKFIGGTGLTDLELTAGSTTIHDLQGFVTKASFAPTSTKTDGFYMTNAVLSSTKGGTAGVPTESSFSVLADLSSNIYSTEAEARTKPAGDIFVERAVAKATVTLASGITPGTSTIGTSGPKIAEITWSLNNTEPSSYNVRNTWDKTSNKYDDYLLYTSEAFSSTPGYNYRMVGSADMGTTTLTKDVAKYRTYWCKDPNYNNASPTNLVKTSNYAETGTDKPQYCYENTFTVANQNYKNSTRAIIKVVTDKTDPFYVVNGDETKLYLESALYSLIADEFIKNADVVAAFKDALNAGKSYTVVTSTFEYVFTEDDKGNQTLSDIKLSSDFTSNHVGSGKEYDNATFWDTFKTKTGSPYSSLVAYINSTYKIVKYGTTVSTTDNRIVVFYEARIKHFAEDENNAGIAPWNGWEADPNKPEAGATTTSSYKGTKAENNYLGRYGMVRNNWYDIEISAFKKLGLPKDPSTKVNLDDTPDDEIPVEKKYLAVKINVLSWAKRTQKWSF